MTLHIWKKRWVCKGLNHKRKTFGLTDKQAKLLKDHILKILGIEKGNSRVPVNKEDRETLISLIPQRYRGFIGSKDGVIHRTRYDGDKFYYNANSPDGERPINDTTIIFDLN